jgi:hypothetical protein
VFCGGLAARSRGLVMGSDPAGSGGGGASEPNVGGEGVCVLRVERRGRSGETNERHKMRHLLVGIGRA